MTTSLRICSPRVPRIRNGVRAGALACGLLAAAAQPAGALHHQQDDGKGRDVPGVTGPAMKIAIGNGRKTSAPGEEATYTIRVASLQDGPIEGIEIRQTLPEGMELVEPGEGARVRGREVSWTADLKGHKKAEFTARTRLAAGVPTKGELAATACAFAKGAERPVVCAPDIDKLTATPVRTGDDGRNRDDGAGGQAAEESETGAAYGLGAGALLLGGGGLVYALRRRAAARRRG
ncbi:hypothetical protein [Streptomyces sp. MAR4 CNX-425]|uniref:hypothetical protein n=1 Tax=Streptomyces sp. MAR4 CNX-425 TaxID=3406343 RepID=UPI003B50AC50